MYSVPKGTDEGQLGWCVPHRQEQLQQFSTALSDSNPFEAAMAASICNVEQPAGNAKIASIRQSHALNQDHRMLYHIPAV